MFNSLSGQATMSKKYTRNKGWLYKHFLCAMIRPSPSSAMPNILLRKRWLMRFWSKHAWQWLICVALISACNAFPAPTPTPPNDKLAEILARGTLVIATDPAYPPQSELVANATRLAETRCEPTQYTAAELTGFDVETAVELARRLGVEPCFVTPQWSQLVAGNWANQWDISAGSMTITYDRMQVLYFSQPYYATPGVFLLHQDNTTIHTLADLSGKQIGVCAGCTFESYLEGTLRLPGQEIEYLIRGPVVVAYENEGPAIEDLALGDGVKLDAALTQLPVSQAAIASGLPLKQLEEPAFFAYAALAIDRKSNKDPVTFVQAVIRIVQAMHTEGFLKPLSLKYHGLDLTTVAAQFEIDNLDQFARP